MGNLGTASTHQIFTMQNGRTLAGTLGLRWKLTCEGGFEKQRYLEVFADGCMMIDSTAYPDLGTLLAAPAADGGGSSAGDVFHLFDASDPTGYVPAVARAVTMSLNGTLEDVGSVRKFSLTIEGLGTQDDYGMTVVDTVHIQTSWEMRQTSLELAYMASCVLNDTIGYTILFPDTATLVLPSQLGFEFNHQAVTDTKDIEFIKVTASGSISPSAFAALWT
jgi:hypothetical protein